MHVCVADSLWSAFSIEHPHSVAVVRHGELPSPGLNRRRRLRQDNAGPVLRRVRRHEADEIAGLVPAVLDPAPAPRLVVVVVDNAPDPAVPAEPHAAGDLESGTENDGVEPVVYEAAGFVGTALGEPLAQPLQRRSERGE